MRVEKHAGRVRRRWLIFLAGQPISSHLGEMVVPMVAIGVSVDFPGRHTDRNHRYQQQQAGQRPDRVL